MRCRVRVEQHAHRRGRSNHNARPAGSVRSAVRLVVRVIVGVRRVQFCTSYIRNKPFSSKQFPVLTDYLSQTQPQQYFLYSYIHGISCHSRRQRCDKPSRSSSDKRPPLPLQCEVVELGLLVYSVAMSRVWLCTYQGCSMTV